MEDGKRRTKTAQQPKLHWSELIDFAAVRADLYDPLFQVGVRAAQRYLDFDGSEDAGSEAAWRTILVYQKHPLKFPNEKALRVVVAAVSRRIALSVAERLKRNRMFREEHEGIAAASADDETYVAEILAIVDGLKRSWKNPLKRLVYGQVMLEGEAVDEFVKHADAAKQTVRNVRTLIRDEARPALEKAGYDALPEDRARKNQNPEGPV